MKAETYSKLRILFQFSLAKSGLKENDFPNSLLPYLSVPAPETLALKRAKPNIKADPVYVLTFTPDAGPEETGELVRFLETKNLPSRSFNIRASLVTDQDISGVSLPEYVLEILWRFRCEIGFSFVVTNESSTVARVARAKSNLSGIQGID